MWSASELEAWAAAVRAPGLGARSLRAALVRAGEITALCRLPLRDLLAIGISPAAAQYLADPPPEDIAADLRWLEQNHGRLFPLTGSRYPLQLAAITSPPVALYVLGDVSALSAPQIAIVGSRNPTAAGFRLARNIASDLAAAGFVVTSGLAQGIDSAAHQGALSIDRRTVAVCGTGLAFCYPASNRNLAERIAASGALVSEFAPDTPPRRSHFPRRNRIISGLARGTVVVEAAADSGSLITARRALDQGRELFVIPGSPLNPQAAGCLELLREGAHLTRDARDILEQTGIPIEGNALPNQLVATSRDINPNSLRLDNDYEMLLDALGFEPATINDLVDRTGLAAGSVASMMLILELQGRVETRPGALFNRVT
jgi:DNA processing protein